MLEPNRLPPFLKWAGGKRWLAKGYADIFNTIQFERYVEPFLGSGALFFALKPRYAILNDINKELIATYVAIRDCWDRVEEQLAIHQLRHEREYYYNVRSTRPRGIAARAARFIYLNRTCFNGIYRVNKGGEFNVPIGTKTTVLLESDDFSAVSKMLKHARLTSIDFEDIIDSCGHGDLIFADPPYTVQHNHNGFIKYNERLFSWSDQERLCACVRRASTRGAVVLVSNADHESVRALYRGCQMERLTRQSVMASEAMYRRATSEILIRV